jgi:hypothetical protein
MTRNFAQFVARLVKCRKDRTGDFKLIDELPIPLLRMRIEELSSGCISDTVALDARKDVVKKIGQHQKRLSRF